MQNIILFILGAAIGSFLNVIALRYDPERFIFSRKVIGGRSRCPHCKKTLRWFELLPFVSFLVQIGKCRHCRKNISWRYPVVELISGLLFVLVPSALPNFQLLTTHYSLLTLLWLVVFAALFLMSLIDLRLWIIPDEIQALLAALAALELFLYSPFSKGGATGGGFLASATFVPDYALLFGLQGNIWLNHFLAALFAGLFFLGIVILTRGRGMGWGDVKLAAALGFLFGWPDIIFAVVFAFILGSVFGVWEIVFGKKTLKTAVPFGPFLGLGCLALVLWGNSILHWYFGLFGW